MSASDFETEVKPCASRRLRFGIVAALTLLLTGAAAMLLLDERLKPADDLMPRRPIPAPQDNGWERLHTLWGEASGVDRNDRRLWLEVLRGKRAWDEELALRIISRGREDLLLKAKEALSLPEWRLPPPNRHVENSDSDRLSFHHHLYTIQARILSSARRGDMKHALESMLVLAELQRRNLSGATSGTVVLSNFGNQSMLQAVPWLAANGTSADDALWAVLQGALLCLEITPDDLDEALRGEAAILLEMTREEGTGPFSIYIGERLERLLFRKKRSFNRVAAFYRSVRGGWLRPLNSAQESWWVMYDGIGEVRPGDFPLYAVENRVLDQCMQNVALLDNAARRSNALTRLTAVRIALHRRQMREGGGPPERLEALVPEYLAAVPADPYDGKPLRWDARTGVLYTLGRDWVDTPPELPGPGWVDVYEDPAIRLVSSSQLPPDDSNREMSD